MNAIAGCLNRFLAACLLLGLAIVALLAWPRVDPADAPPKPIRIAIGMTVRDFIARNGLSIGEWKRHGFAVEAEVIDDVSSIIFDDHWIAPTAADGDQGFALPPGRTLHVRQNAGRIEGFAFRPFASPRPLDEVAGYADALIARLQADGWRPRFPPDTPRTATDFDRNGKALFGEHMSRNGSVLQLNIREDVYKRQLLHHLLEEGATSGAHLAAFDAAERTFVAGSLVYAEGIEDFIAFLAMARSAADHLHPAGHGIAIVHNYLWGGPAEQVTTAAVRMMPSGESRLLAASDQAAVVPAFQPIVDALMEGVLPAGFPVRDQLRWLR